MNDISFQIFGKLFTAFIHSPKLIECWCRHHRSTVEKKHRVKKGHMTHTLSAVLGHVIFEQTAHGSFHGMSRFKDHGRAELYKKHSIAVAQQ